MIRFAGNGAPPDAKTRAAIMAAIESYLAQEDDERTQPKTDPRLSAWKTAAWSIFRPATPPGPHTTWRGI